MSHLYFTRRLKMKISPEDYFHEIKLNGDNSLIFKGLLSHKALYFGHL